MSFEIYLYETLKEGHVYKCKGWKILSLENLEVDVKYEFNSDNHCLYSDKLIIAENTIAH